MVKDTGYITYTAWKNNLETRDFLLVEIASKRECFAIAVKHVDCVTDILKINNMSNILGLHFKLISRSKSMRKINEAYFANLSLSMRYTVPEIHYLFGWVWFAKYIPEKQYNEIILIVRIRYVYILKQHKKYKTFYLTSQQLQGRDYGHYHIFYQEWVMH